MKHSSKNRNGLAVAQGLEAARHEAPLRSVAGAAPSRTPGTILGGTQATQQPPGQTPLARITEPKSIARPTREQIERRAYELYLARQGRDGSPEQDWLQAERELSGSGGLRA